MSLESSKPLETPKPLPIPKSSKLAKSNAGIVIIGAGMAGSRFAIELARTQQNDTGQNHHEQNHDGSDSKAVPITLISKEPQVGYNRIMLSPVLAGETSFDDTYLYTPSDYEQLGITVLAGTVVDTIDTKQQTLQLDDGQILSYAKVVIATGSSARVIPFPNHTATGVHVFRDLADVTVLTQYAQAGKSGIVIGGGVLGLEAAFALQTQGADMTVVHMDGYVLNRQLDRAAAQLLQSELHRRGIGLEVSAITQSIAINDEHEVCGLLLQDERTLPADFIVMAVGVMPNMTLAKDSGIAVNRGIIVDDCMHTSCPNVYAIGECVELDGELFGMVAPIHQQVDTLVSVLKDTRVANDGVANDPTTSDQVERPAHWQPFVSKPLSLKLKVSGIAAFSAGQIDFADHSSAVANDHASDDANDNDSNDNNHTAKKSETIETITYHQTGLNHYHCLYLKNNRLIGAVLYGDVSEGGFYSQLITDHTDVSQIKDNLIFGAAYCELDQLNTDDIDNETTNNNTMPVNELSNSDSNRANHKYNHDSDSDNHGSIKHKDLLGEAS